MRMRLLMIPLLAFAAASAVAAPDCSLKSTPLPPSPGTTALPPISADLPAASHALGMPDDVFAYGSDEGQAVDRVLARLREEACKPAPQAAAGADGAYVPRTKWDNTPYRFNAGGNGKKFSAAEFSAWMESKGIHVSKGAPQPVTANPPAPQGATPQADPNQPNPNPPLK